MGSAEGDAETLAHDPFLTDYRLVRFSRMRLMRSRLTIRRTALDLSAYIARR